MTKLVSLATVSHVGESNPASKKLRGGVISIGNFDGVHLGHTALLKTTRQMANRLGGPAVAVVLDPHPASILRPENVPPKLTLLERRAELMESADIDYLAVCPTSREFLSLSAETFFQSLIVHRLAAQGMVEGPNFYFGRGRSGNSEVLSQLCQQAAIELSIVQPTLVDGEMISSTRIRRLLEAGDFAAAHELLGAPYRVCGRVVQGERRGRQIGFPTANLEQIDVVVPAPGVYGGIACTETEPDQRYLAAIHIGPNPTFDQGTSKTEIHLLDYAGDLYGQRLLVDFVTSVRDIARFDSADQLANQLAKDVSTIRNQLATQYHDAVTSKRVGR